MPYRSNRGIIIKSMIKLGSIFVLLVLIIILLPANMGCNGDKSFNARLNEIVNPYRFSLIGWEFQTLSDELNDFLFGTYRGDAEDISLVNEYFSIKRSLYEITIEKGPLASYATIEVILTALQKRLEKLEPKVDKIIERQIRNTLSELGIHNPVYDCIGLSVGFPPVNFILEPPPYLLVVSPRDRIESIREIMLKPDITLEEIAEIEAAVDQLGVSSIIVKLGGVSTYPSFVSNGTSFNLRSTIEIAVEEWLHQYLFFKPLGFSYALHISGIHRDYQITVLNEAAVGIISEEIVTSLFNRYYGHLEIDAIPENGDREESVFHQEMREIRRNVDRLLSKGMVIEAEQFMEQKRTYLSSLGYYIRKLNQAYFAFKGMYADEPTSIDPIGEELRILRNQCYSVSQFLSIVANMNSRQDLTERVED